MSAFMMSKVAIDLLASALTVGEIALEHPDAVGKALWTEQLASLAYRYPADGSGERPGPIGLLDEHVQAYRFHSVDDITPLSPARLNGLVACYRYQSCEHPAWEGSNSERWTAQLATGLRRQVGDNYAGWDLMAQELGLPSWRNFVADAAAVAL